MRAEEALNIARRINNRWRGTARVEDWVDALAPLDHPHALATFAHFAKTAQDPGPSIKRFVERLELDHPTSPEPESGRMSRDQALGVMTAAGAPRRLLSKHYQEGPL